LGTSQTGPHCGATPYTLTILDINGNAPAAWDASDGVTATAIDVGGAVTPSVSTPSTYEDWSGAGQPNLGTKNSQGVVTVDVSDGHSCPCTSCGAFPYEITFSLSHTLDESSSAMHEDLSALTVGGTWQ
jgi:hypothetical protein